MMENNTQSRNMASMSWQDVAFGLLGSALFVMLLFVLT